MNGCHNCGALSGLDPRGTCNACGKPCSYKVALEQLESTGHALANARPGPLTSNTGYRLATAEAQLAAVRRELRDWEAADSACQGSPRAHLEAIDAIVNPTEPRAS